MITGNTHLAVCLDSRILACSQISFIHPQNAVPAAEITVPLHTILFCRRAHVSSYLFALTPKLTTSQNIERAHLNVSGVGSH